jgi:DNA-directed RNA polymerase subunit RPC12/RpoP
MSRKSRPDTRGFTCLHCRRSVDASSFGTRHRNHCPYCLHSRHVDEEPGDRRSPCRASMRPVALEVRRDGEWAILHRCDGCGTLRANRIAGDDHELALLSLALRPLANPPFPLDCFGAFLSAGGPG